jgi:hypothetical protein
VGNLIRIQLEMRELMKIGFRGAITFALLVASLLAAAQTPYQPKFHGDPARSESEAIALGYVRVVIRAENQYQRKNGKYAATLSQLVHSGSVTRRMTQTDRGDYTVGFRSRKDGYELTLTPKQLDAQHRSFYTNDDGVIHADEEKAATEDSPALK